MHQPRHLHLLAAALAFALATACLTIPLWAQSDESTWPDISSPGLDLGDFPNSAFTLPAGACQLECAPFSILGSDRFSQPEYFTQFLFRLGLTDDVEFRVLGNGFTAVYTEPTMTGFSPIALDGKVHLWDDRREWLLPASSLEVVLSTNWGSQAFSSGYRPSINMNFDFPITRRLNFEWTVGYGEVVGTLVTRSQRPKLTAGNRLSNLLGNQLTNQLANRISNQVGNQVSFQWAFEQDLTDRLQAFITGSTTGAAAGQSGGTAIAVGGFQRWTNRLTTFGLIGWGATSNAPRIGAQLGFGIAL